MSTLKVRQTLAQMSPLTREVLDRINLIQQQPWTFEQKQGVQERMMAMLTPEQKADIEREALRTAMDMSAMMQANGNRAERRKARAARGRARK